MPFLRPSRRASRASRGDRGPTRWRRTRVPRCPIIHGAWLGLCLLLTLTASPSSASTRPLPPIFVHTCIDEFELRRRVDELLPEGELTWPDGLSYSVRTDARGQLFITIAHGNGERSEFGPLTGTCEELRAAAASTIASELASRATVHSADDSVVVAEPLPTAFDHVVIDDLDHDGATPTSVPDSVDLDPPATSTRVPSSAAPLLVHPLLSLRTGYTAIPTLAGRRNGHATELQPRVELLDPGAFSVGLGLRMIVGFSDRGQNRALVGELTVCRFAALSKFDLGLCGSGAFGRTRTAPADDQEDAAEQNTRRDDDSPAETSDHDDDRTASQGTFLLTLGARADWWVRKAGVVHLLVGATATFEPLLDGTSPLYPYVSIGTSFAFGCRDRGPACRPRRRTSRR